MKKNYILMIAMILLSRNINAQTFQWAKPMGGTSTSIGQSIAVDALGNVYTTGYFAGTTDFDPGAAVFNLTSTGSFDIFISKLDASGNFVWAKQLGGSGSDDRGFAITVDGSGNVYTTGSFNSTADFDPGAGTFTLTSGWYSMFVSKLDASGNFVWAKQMGGGGDCRGYSIKTDGSNNVYTTGYFMGTSDFDPGAGTFNLISAGQEDIFVSKLNASGNFVWAQRMGGTLKDEGNSIAVDASGNVHTTGYFQGTADFDPSASTFNLISAGADDIFVSKLDVSGNFVWAVQLAGGNERGLSLDVDISGNVYTTGYFGGSCDFDPGSGNFFMSAFAVVDVFVSKLNASGNFVWAKQLGGNSTENGYSISVDGSGNVYTAGRFAGTADFDPGAGTFTLTTVNYNVFVSKLDALGNFVWAAQLAGPGNSYGNSLALDGVGNIYTTGFFQNTGDFDPGAGVYNLTAVGSQDIFVHKMASCVSAPSQPGSISGSVTVCSGNTPTYSVAAVGGATSYTWSLPGGWTGSSSTNVINTTASATSGNITISAGNACGASIVQTLSVTVNTIPTTPGTINGNITICSGSSNTYSVATIAGATSYNWVKPGGWTGASTTNIINTTASATSGNITVSASNACGTSALQTLSVTVNSIPATPGTINGLTSKCAGSGASNYSVAAVAGATSYTWSLPGGWSGSSTTNIISATPGSSGIFTVTASNVCGTSAQQTLSITVNPLPTITVNSGSICSGNSFTMVPSGASTYTFQGGSATVTPTTTTSYTVTGTSTAGCVSASPATSNVTVVTTPTVNAGSSPTITCTNSTVSLNGSGVTTYTWSGTGIVSGGNTSNPVVNMGGTYSVSGSTGGCNSNIATVTVMTNTIAPTVSANTSNSIICGPPFQGTATLTASGASTYTWNPGGAGTSIAVSPSVTSQYTVTGTNAVNGCTNSTVFTQSVSTCTGLNQISNSVSEINVYPNPFNNKITIISSGEKQTVQIFNPLGSLIYKTEIENEKIEIDLEKENSGIYFIRIGTGIKKIIKE